MTYQRIILSGPTIDGEPGLPTELQGLAQESLDDLGAALDPCPNQYIGMGCWPVLPVQQQDGKVVVSFQLGARCGHQDGADSANL